MKFSWPCFMTTEQMYRYIQVGRNTSGSTTTLIVWGKNDYIFPANGAFPYKKDLKNLEFHLLDTGHFALEEDGDEIAEKIRNFLSAQNNLRTRE